MGLCIPKDKIQEVKKLFNKVSGKTGAEKLEKVTNMTLDERTKFFSKVMPEFQAKKLSNEYKKAVISKRQDALTQWIKKNLDEEYRKGEIKALNDRKFKSIKDLEKYVETRADILANKKHGVALTPKEAEKFTKLGTKLYKVGAELGEDFGDVLENTDKMYKFGKIHQELTEFTDSLLPKSIWDSLFNSWGRASMLASPKTMLLNLESNSINAMIEALIRRVVNGKLVGKLDKEMLFPVYKMVKKNGKETFKKVGEENIIKAYKKNAYNLYKETGLDVSRMISMDDTVAGSGKLLGEKASKPKNRIARAYTDFVFEKMLTEPDVRYSNYAFADSASILASKMSKNDTKKANEFFKDAIRIGGHKTDEGKIIRETSIADARRATYTNDSGSAKFANSTRDLLNLIPYLHVGDITMPFVKTVANVAELGLDYSGLGLVKHGNTLRLAVGKALFNKGKVDRDALRALFADATRAGIGMTVAGIIASQIDEGDFIGAYDPSRAGIDQLANTSYNAIRIGDRWYSIDYLGPLAIPMVGMLYAKKYNKKNKVSAYAYGAGSAFLNQMPMTDPILTTVDNFKKSIQSQDKMSKVFGDTIKRTATDILASRMIPGIIPDIAKAMDEYQRNTTDTNWDAPFVGEINYGKLLQKLPGARNTLPIKYNAFGKDLVETQSVIDLLTKFTSGARIKKDMSDDIVDEVFRLRDEGSKPNVRDLRFMRSNTKAGKLKAKVGKEKFYEIAKQYGQDIRTSYEEIMQTHDYKDADNIEKKKLLDAEVDKLYEALMKEYNINNK